MLKSEKKRKKVKKSEKSEKIYLNFASLCLASVSALVCEAIDESEELCLDHCKSPAPVPPPVVEAPDCLEAEKKNCLYLMPAGGFVQFCPRHLTVHHLIDSVAVVVLSELEDLRTE